MSLVFGSVRRTDQVTEGCEELKQEDQHAAGELLTFQSAGLWQPQRGHTVRPAPVLALCAALWRMIMESEAALASSRGTARCRRLCFVDVGDRIGGTQQSWLASRAEL
jgi:hypothetical protein